jgi:uncharacterized protein (DUF2141 family)
MRLRSIVLAAAAFPVAATATMTEPGMTDARCRPDESGPAIMVEVRGLKDRTGYLRLELYPPNKDDFLAADTVLIAAGKTFRRVLEPPPPAGPVALCIRVPQPGRYALTLVHNRDGERRFSIWHDGVGVPSNPTALHGSPSVSQAEIEVGAGVTRIAIVMDYMRGFFTFGPLGN